MQERTSKTLLLVETITLLAPITLLTTFYSLALLVMYGSGLSREPAGAHIVAGFTFLGLVLQLCGWRIVIAFLGNGRPGIAEVPHIYFYVVCLGAFLVFFSLLLLLLTATGVELPTYTSELMVNYIAAPALVPCCHVLAERAFATRRTVADPALGQPFPVHARADSQNNVVRRTASHSSIDALRAAVSPLAAQ